MEHLECPTIEVWEARRTWFEGQFDIEKRGGGYVLGEQATGLLVDLQAVFCSGAWAATLILSATVIEAHLREAELPEEFEGGIKAVFDTVPQFSLEWLRVRRNRLVHFRYKNGSALTVEDQWRERSAHEQDARRAVESVATVLLSQPYT